MCLARPAALLHLWLMVVLVVLACGVASRPAFAAPVITNTAQLSYVNPLLGSPISMPSNATSLQTIPAEQDAIVTLYHYSPNNSSATNIPFSQGTCTSAGLDKPLPDPVDTVTGQPIAHLSPTGSTAVPVSDTKVFHGGDPLFIVVNEPDVVTDPTVIQAIVVVVTSSTGDSETLVLQETAPGSGVFSGVIQTTGPGVALQKNDCQLSVGENSTIKVRYTDPYYKNNIGEATALTDPTGIVFDSLTGLPVNGAKVTLINVVTNQPAVVYGDDGKTPLVSSTEVTGGSIADKLGHVYTFPTGGYRFPFIAPGSYKLVVVPPTGYTAPSVVAVISLPKDPNGNAYTVVTGSYADVFNVNPGPVVHVDIPVDPQAKGLQLTKTVSQTTVTVGDFLEYQLALTNVDPDLPASNVNVVDTLPAGMHFRKGSLRINNTVEPDPAVSSDGRTLTIPAQTLTPGGADSISYVVELGVGTPSGQAINVAQASASVTAEGVTTRESSNVAKAAVTVKPPFYSDASTIIGRVFQGECKAPFSTLKGVPDVRLLMEDGSYVVSDKDGQFHFGAVPVGTHVVQLDVDSLPKNMEAISCLDNTRFAGRSYSQFVEVQGGGLWRADFFVRTKPQAPDVYSPKADKQTLVSTTRNAEVGIKLESALDVEVNRTSTAAAAALPVPEAPVTVKNYTVHAHFDSCQATIVGGDMASITPLLRDLKGEKIASVELTGYTDNQRLSPRCKQHFADNNAISKARAQTLADLLAKSLDLRADQIIVKGGGEANPVASNGNKAGMAKNRRTEISVNLLKSDAVAAPVVKAVASSPVVKTQTRLMGLLPRVELDGTAPVNRFNVTVVMPAHTHYVQGSSQLDGQPLPDPEFTDGIATFRLGDITANEWHKVISFKLQPDRAILLVDKSAAPATPSRPEAGKFNLSARFASCSTEFKAGADAAIAKLATQLSEFDIDRIEVVGNTDNQRMSPRCKALFADNKALSLARAKVVGEELATLLGLGAGKVVARGDGESNPIASNATAAGMALNRRTEVVVFGTRKAAHSGKTADPAGAQANVGATAHFELRALATFESQEKPARTPVVDNRLLYIQDVAPPTTPVLTDPNLPVVHDVSNREAIKLVVDTPAATAELRAEKKIRDENNAKRKTRKDILDDVAAAGGKTDWLKGQTPGVEWLFPAEGHNPRGPAVRIVIKHEPKQTVELRRASGELVDPLNFDGTTTNGEKTVTISAWRGVHINEGDNIFVASIKDASGKVVKQLIHNVYFADAPVKAELVEDQSVLIADGITSPVLAVRLLDRTGHPVRAGYTGPLQLSTPYITAQQLEEEQKRQLAGTDSFKPQYRVEGDDGIAYIDLAPTTVSGNVQLTLSFRTGADTSRTFQLQSWVAPGPRKWVVVGFSEGTVGYNTLKAHMSTTESAVDSGVEKGFHADDKTAFYAKGSILGKWIVTAAYNTRKSSMDGTGGQPGIVNSVLDPGKYYTLYGDGSAERYDASSQRKLYLKLEEGQFYALFGDYNTGLNQTKLSRYQRNLNGIKVEQGGGAFNYVMFAASTPQNSVRDEIQGNGTSGLYQLTHGGIVLNSEQISVETRDRLHADVVLNTQLMTQHIDYEIDYDNGTIFFKQPIAGHDQNFNPQIIVATYETVGNASKELDAGGRASVKLADGAVTVGATAVHDEQNLRSSELKGLDVKVKVGTDAEVRVEGARTSGANNEGNAWLAEYESHSRKADTLVYARDQGSSFGVGQLSPSTSGMQKEGVEQQYHINDHLVLQGQAYQQTNAADDKRDALAAKLQYKTDNGSVSVGMQSVADKAGTTAVTGGVAGQSYNSDQATIAANRFFYNRKFELSGEADTSAGTRNSSVDFPDRYMLGAAYNVTTNTKLVANEEITQGSSYDSANSRVGFQTVPWKGANLQSTLNQSQISEYGPRTFAEYGLHQGFVVNKQWGVDLSYDSSHTVNGNKLAAGPVVQTNSPVAAAGNLSAVSPALTLDYQAVSTGATYRADLWSWAGRLEDRWAQDVDRKGVTSSFLRQARVGVAFGSSLQAFHTDNHQTGMVSTLASVDGSVAYRPLGTQWSFLDRLEFRYNNVTNGDGGTSGLGLNTLTVGSGTTRHVINNFSLNHISREWTDVDMRGNLFSHYERSQWTLYYGSKYVVDNIDGSSYTGYSDILGFEGRHDLTARTDVGVQASVMNGWTTHTHAYSFGPAFGFTPIENGWVTMGYNFKGFQDRDFDAARYTAQGIYLQLRIKFDQNTRLEDLNEPVKLPFANAKPANATTSSAATAKP